MFDNTDNISLLTHFMKLYLEFIFLPTKEIKVKNNVSKKRKKKGKISFKKEKRHKRNKIKKKN